MIMKPGFHHQLLIFLIVGFVLPLQAQIAPDQIQFVRQGVKRLIFDRDQGISLATLNPDEIIGMTAMHPVHYYSAVQANIYRNLGRLIVASDQSSEASIWLGGFNPFASYVINLADVEGRGEMGMEFSDPDKQTRMLITISFESYELKDVRIKVMKEGKMIADESIGIEIEGETAIGELIFQMYGSGLSVFIKRIGLPTIIGQVDFNQWVDLRKKQYVQSFHSSLYFQLWDGKVLTGLIDGCALARIATVPG